MLWMNLAFLTMGLSPAFEPAPLLVTTMIDQYELQTASRDTLEAMGILDSLSGATFLKMGGYDFTWNPQDQTVEFFKADGTLVEETITGIDGIGRQSFAIPVTENATICGWVDVDMVHNRIVVEMGSERAFIELVTDDTTNAVFPGAIARISCACISNNTHIGGCGFSWCRPPRACRGGQNSGTCDLITVTDPAIAPG